MIIWLTPVARETLLVLFVIEVAVDVVVIDALAGAEPRGRNPWSAMFSGVTGPASPPPPGPIELVGEPKIVGRFESRRKGAVPELEKF